jgi:hypothetical protein
MSFNPFEQRAQERQQLNQSQPPIQSQPEQNISNPFEERAKIREPQQYEKDLEQIWEGGEETEKLAEKGTAKATSRVLESALGTPGNIQAAIKGITGLQLGTQLPTTKNIQGFSEKATKGYTKPESEFEEKGGEILQDITAMATPGATSYGALRTIGIPIAGWMAKEGLEKVGASEDTGNLVKTGLMVALDLASAWNSKGRGGAKNYAKELWQEGEKNIPKGVKVKASDLESSLQTLKTELEKGGSSPTTTHALTKIDEILKKVANGKIPVDELVAFRKNINKLIENGGGFDFTTSSGTRQGSIYNLNQVKDKVIDTLDQYGKINPAFGVPYKQANEAYSVYHTSNAASRWLQSKFGNFIKSPVFHGLFGTVAKGAAAAAVPWQAGKIVYRVMNSPVLSELYGNVLKATINNDTAAAAQNLQRLKKEMANEEVSQSERKKDLP